MPLVTMSYALKWKGATWALHTPLPTNSPLLGGGGEIEAFMQTAATKFV